MTANSRMIHAFSRDGALPFSHVSRRTRRRPALLPRLTAYAAVTSVAVIGPYIAYVVPTPLRLRKGDALVRGPWHLGRSSGAVGWWR